MFKHYFEGIEYITVGPIIGLVVFLLFFIFLLYQVFIVDKSFISKMENMPLDDESEDEEKKSKTTQT